MGKNQSKHVREAASIERIHQFVYGLLKCQTITKHIKLADAKKLFYQIGVSLRFPVKIEDFSFRNAVKVSVLIRISGRNKTGKRKKK